MVSTYGLCIGWMGFRNPLAVTATMCDAEKACWLNHFASETEYTDCTKNATDGMKPCKDACDVDTDTTDIDSTHSDCLDACDSTFDDCNTRCQSNYDSAVAACPDPIADPSGNADCMAAAFTDKDSCLTDCDNAWGHCRSGCDDNYQIALASLPIVDARCAAACCNADGNHVNRKIAECQHTQNDTKRQNGIDYWTCFSECLDPVNGGHDPTCTDACSNQKVLDDYDADTAAALCESDASNAWSNIWEPCGVNYWCDKPCTAAYAAALRDCIEAAFTDGSGYLACTLAAAQDQLRCNTNCCYNLKGKNPWDPPALECEITFQTCQSQVEGKCPVPASTNPSDPCYIPDSPACTAATTAHTACLTTETCTCNSQLKDCLAAIPAKAPGACGGCVTVDTPVLTGC